MEQGSQRKPRAPLRERFWAKVAKPDDPDGCWLWTAACIPQGYGTIGLGGRSAGKALAHRLSWEWHRGPIPDGIWVLHRCDVRRCVNPDHLFLGTHDDNMADMARKGRSAAHAHPERVARGDRSGMRRHPERVPRGERNGTARITEADVLELRRLYAAGGITQTALAERFGIDQTNVSLIINRRHWRHVA